MRILITGGAGFVGSALALAFRKESAKDDVVVLDNLKRRGSELNLPEFAQQGINFIHGDIRQSGDLDDLPGNFDFMIEASAEPSVLAGLQGNPHYLLDTNLTGTINCLEFARRRAPNLIFLSTSRVYSIKALRGIPLSEKASRFELAAHQEVSGLTAHGIAEEFSTRGARSLYGTTKLASELLIEEYIETYNMRAIINRCGVIAGPGQFGKVDQGVFTLWMARHFFKRPLAYKGFGGEGKQVRDLLHPRDLFNLLKCQMDGWEEYSGETFNAGGGQRISTSLCELTELCREISGNEVPISREPSTLPVDIPFYVTDSRKAQQCFNWEPRQTVPDIMNEIHLWLRQNTGKLRSIFE